MTTFYPFTPPPRGTFRFQPVLDRQVHSADVRWSLFGRRWYLALDSIDGVPVCNVPLIGSMTGLDIQALNWIDGRAVAQFIAPHGFAILDTFRLTVRDCSPKVYNGRHLVFVHDPLTVSWALQSDPGEASRLGNASYDINLVGGYFAESSIVYRGSLQRFEVDP